MITLAFSKAPKCNNESYCTVYVRSPRVKGDSLRVFGPSYKSYNLFISQLMLWWVSWRWLVFSGVHISDFLLREVVNSDNLSVGKVLLSYASSQSGHLGCTLSVSTMLKGLSWALLSGGTKAVDSNSVSADSTGRGLC